MGVVVWTFQRTAEGAFEILSKRAHDDFYFGRAPLPPDPDGFVRLAVMQIVCRDRQPVDIGASWYPKYRVRPGGLIDLLWRFADEWCHDELMKFERGRKARSGSVIHDRRLLERRARHLHVWELSEEDVGAFAKAIDSRAGRRIV